MARAVKGNPVLAMSRTVSKSSRKLISEYTHSLVSDPEWRVLVDLHAESEQRRHWYFEGYRDGQCDALREAAEVISATAKVMPNDETRQIALSLASILTFMASNEPRESEERKAGRAL